MQYDPNRSSRIALLHYVDGEKRYILCPAGLEAGQTVVTSGQNKLSNNAPVTINNDIDPNVWVALGTRAGGEPNGAY